MTHWQRIGIALAIAASAGSIAFAAFFDERVPFLVDDAQAPWIAAPIPVETHLRRVAPGHSWGATFERRFRTERAGTASLEARALGWLAVQIDGRPIALASPFEDEGTAPEGPPDGRPPDSVRCLKTRCRAELALDAGDHEIRVRVVNERGPPLLSLSLDGPRTELQARSVEWRIDSGSGFRVRAGSGGTPLAAVRADDTRPLPAAIAQTEPIDALRRLAPVLAILALVGALLPGSLRLARARGLVPATGVDPRIGGLALLLVWCWIFAARFSELPLESGFDAYGHLEYVQHIADHRAFPERDHGWSTYHPPAFYALAAIPVSLAGGQPYTSERAVDSSGESDPRTAPYGARERLAMRLVPWLMALGTIALVWRAATLAAPDDPRVAWFAAGFAGLLPLQITMAAYVSNEGTHAFFASAALVCAGSALTETDPKRRRRPLVLTALALGAALLSKFTGLLVAAVVCAFVGFGTWQAHARSFGRALALSFAVAAGALAIGGGFYVQNLLRFGDPIVWNLDFPGRDSWWVQPGFHTSAYFTSFGDSFRRPFFSSFTSFWDALYTTLLGDGQLGGFASWQARPAVWDWDWIAAGYWVLAPWVAAAGVGAALLVRDSLRGNDLGRRAFLALVATLGFGLLVSVVSAVLRYPFFGTARASYALAILVPLSLAAARGALAARDAIARTGRFAPLFEAIGAAWLACCAGTVLFSYAF